MILTKDTTLLPLLIEINKGMSRSKVKQLLQSGRVLVNGKAVTQFDHPLKPGDCVDIGAATMTKRPLSNKWVQLVYEDKYLVVIDKREGILSMATSHHAFCVKTVLDNYFEARHQRCHAHIVHRLDRDTSGLMIFAKSHDVQQRFEADWKGIVYDRRYVAVAEGIIENDNNTITSWLKENKQGFVYSDNSQPPAPDAKYAVTHYKVLERGKTNTLVELRLDTGRKNQIRVHLSDLNHPVVGDPKYSAQSTVAPRLCLHAYRLHFTHPITGEQMLFDTPIPGTFRGLL